MPVTIIFILRIQSRTGRVEEVKGDPELNFATGPRKRSYATDYS